MMLAVFLNVSAACLKNAETPRTQRRGELSDPWDALQWVLRRARDFIFGERKKGNQDACQ